MHILLYTFYVAIGALSGFLGSLLGVGAGVILMPVLLTLGFAPAQAVGASLIAVFMSSLTGTIQNFVVNSIPKTPIIIMAVPGFLSALFGVFLYTIIPAQFIIFLFAGVMFTNLDLILAKKISYKNEDKPHNPKKYFLHYVMIASIAGVLASMLGIGGGLILLPMLVFFTHHSIKDAVKISVAVMTITAFSALLGHHLLLGQIQYLTGFILGVGAVAGAFFGTITLEHVSQKSIKKWVRICLLDLGIYMLFKAFFV